MSSAAANVVEISGLHKVFRDFWRRPKVRAVDGVDLSVRAGEIFGLLGPNGSGKSTIIKILLGLLFPSAGTVRVFGASPRHVATKHHIGYLAEESYLYRHLTPRETLDFYGRLFALDAATRRTRVRQLLEMVGLIDAADRPVGEFSKGMARRVGLAQALINAPRLLVLDEPTSGLDPLGCRQVKDLMLALARQGTTILVTSHLLADVEDVCDRVAILYNGRVHAQGPVRDLLRVRETVQLSMPDQSPERMAELLALLRARFGVAPTVEHPAMDLERYFLEVVERAQGQAPASSGAGRGGGLAPFLGGTPP